MDGRLTITEVAKTLNVTPRTIMRWEKSGKIKKSKRDWRGWRFFHKDDLAEIKKFYESTYEYDEFERQVSGAMKNIILFFALTGFFSYILCGAARADAEISKESMGIRETKSTVDIVLDELPAVNAGPEGAVSEPVNYTLGPNDVLHIEVRRHPEFSGEYTVNSEGKIQYKFVGDLVVNGRTKKELKDELTAMLAEYLIAPEVDVQIVAYLSKVFYVVGDVGNPGKFYMRGDAITVREALVQAGLPTHAAAMRRCRLITPDEKGKNNFVNVNVYSLLYEGNLKENVEMQPGDVLYVPATVMAKIIRVISPVTGAVGQVTGATREGAGAAAVAAAAL